MQFWVKAVVVATLAAPLGSVRADVFKYVDSETGRLIYSNKRSNLSASIFLPASSPVPSLLPSFCPTTEAALSAPARSTSASERHRRASKRVIASAGTPPDFPRVSRTAQQQHDSDRRRILQDELDFEKSALGAALEKGGAEDIVHRHRENIAALEREINRIP